MPFFTLFSFFACFSTRIRDDHVDTDIDIDTHIDIDMNNCIGADIDTLCVRVDVGKEENTLILYACRHWERRETHIEGRGTHIEGREIHI